MKSVFFLFLILFNAFSLSGHGFAAGTLVKVPGGYCPIEQLAVGDKVISFDREFQLSEQTITQKICYVTDKVASVTTCSGHHLIMSWDHRVYLPVKKMWQYSARLVPQDLLLSAQGERIAIESLNFYEQPALVFDISVSNHHTFFVTPCDIAVHNFGIALIFAFGGGGVELCFAKTLCALGCGLIGWIGKKLFETKDVGNSNSTYNRSAQGSPTPSGSPDPNNEDWDNWWKNKKRRLTNQEATRLAEELGFERVKNPPFNTQGELAFEKGGIYISPDNTGHGGGIWKVFDRKGDRGGTFNWNLTKMIRG